MQGSNVRNFETFSPDPAECQRRALEATGVAPLLKRNLVALSNGELRKVLLARALAQNPRLLILDDPLSGLDARSQRASHKVVRSASRMGISLDAESGSRTSQSTC